MSIPKKGNNRKRAKGRYRKMMTASDTLKLVLASIIALGLLSGGILIIGNKFNLFSPPWMETTDILSDWSVPIGIFLILFGGSGMVISLKSQRGRTLFPVVSILCLLFGIAFSDVGKEPVWHGADGESMDEHVVYYDPLMDRCCIVVGADGHQIRLHNNPMATNPTYKELLAFLRKDETDQIPYDFDEFACADYAEVLHNNAENAGMRAAYVTVEFPAHAFNAFRTVDKGLVYMDMSSGYDCIIHMNADGSYQPVSLFSDVRFHPMELTQCEVHW